MFNRDPRFNPFNAIFSGLLDGCYAAVLSLMRVRIPKEAIGFRAWLWLVILHGSLSYPFIVGLNDSQSLADIGQRSPLGFFYLALFFVGLRLMDLATLANKHSGGGDGFYFGKPPLPPALWKHIPPQVWWWLETLVCVSIIAYWISPSGERSLRPLFDSHQIAFMVFLVGFVWRCLKEKMGFALGSVGTQADSHGSAGWAAEASIKAANLRHEKGLLLGYFGGKPLRTSGEGNLLTAAPAGAGKGTCTVIPNLLEYEGPVIVTDLKGENFNITAKRREQMGHKVIRLDPFGVCQGRSDSFNPLDSIRRDDPHANDRAIEIAEMLVLPNPQSTDPHWDERAKDFIRIFVLYILCEMPPARRHLGTLRWLVTQSEDSFNVILRVMENYTGAGGLISRGAVVIKSVPKDERASIFSSIHRHTAFLDSAAATASLEKTTFDPEELITSGKLSIYLVLPHNKLVFYNRLLRLWISSLIGVVTRHGVAPRGRPRICFMLDEMAQLGRMEPIVSAITLLRGYGFTIWSIVQDINQLKTLYPNNEWNTIISNSKYRMFSCVAENDTAEYLSKALGDQTVIYETDSSSVNTGYSSGSNRNHSGGFGNDSSNGYNWGTQRGNTSTTSTQRVARKLLAIDEIMRLPYHKQILLLQGSEPILNDKVDFFRDKRLSSLATTN